MLSRRRPGRRGPAAEGARRSSRGRDRRARRGAPTSSSERSFLWLVASRFFVLMGGAFLINLVVLVPGAVARAWTQDERAASILADARRRRARARLIAIDPGRAARRTGSAASRSSTSACVIGAVGAGARRARAGDPDRHRRGGALRASARDVPGGRLGADDRHHPQGLVGSVHGPLERRDGVVGVARRRDRRAAASTPSADGRIGPRARSAGVGLFAIGRCCCAGRRAAPRGRTASIRAPDPASHGAGRRAAARPRPDVATRRAQASNGSAPIQPRDERPEVDEVVEPDRPRPEAEQRLELDDRQRQQ